MHELRGPTRASQLHRQRAMGAIMTAYGTYLCHGVPPSPKRERSIGLLQGLEQRLTPLVVTPQGQEESVIPLTMHEIQVLWEADGRFYPGGAPAGSTIEPA